MCKSLKTVPNDEIEKVFNILNLLNSAFKLTTYNPQPVFNIASQSLKRFNS